MVSVKRDFTNFQEFPGKIEQNGIYEFPTLYHKDERDRMRIWKISIRVIENDNSKISSIDWELNDEKQSIIKPSYITDATPINDNYIVELWVETGIKNGKITRNIPTYIEKIAFEGQSNQRNQFQQALIEARKQFEKRKEKGGSENPTGKKQSESSNLYFPMLAHTFKKGERYLKFPLFVQPKLDGVRCISFLSEYPGSADKVIIYSRQKKIFPSMDYLKKILYPYLKQLYDEENDQSIYLDGELYKHGKSLQEISGEARNEKKREGVNLNQYHLYDCFYPKDTDVTYSDRKAQLDELFSGIQNKHKNILKQVETNIAKNMKEVDKLYEKYTGESYEGVILRNSSGLYLTSNVKNGENLRSYDLVKLKKKETDEFEIVDYTQGSKGKDLGALIWVVKNNNDIKFNVTPKDMTYEERYKIFAQCEKSFDKLYKGKLLTVEHEGLSDDGVPLRAKGVTIRDYE